MLRHVLAVIVSISSVSASIAADDVDATKGAAYDSKELSENTNVTSPTEAKPVKRNDKDAVKLIYRHLPVNYVEGTTLYYKDKPLRAKKIVVEASDIYWMPYINDKYGIVGRAEGHNNDATSEYQWPGAKRFQIIVYQGGGNIQGLNSGENTINLSNAKNIQANINDRNAEASYLNNHGAYDLAVTVIED